ncbi:MAG: DUF456 domain-containing protein [Saprospiraceae bacterium]|nr:DUF456 domain-containing protein [Saprospiraceae bacterium]
MDIVLAILAAICLITGLIGAVLPLPGPPLSYLGIWLLEWSSYADFSSGLLWALGLATIAVTVLDYVVPLWGVKKFGGSKAGAWGSTIGLIVGMFFGPLGIFIGAFAGALAGELAAGRNSRQATRAAFGSFIGFLLGTGLKLVLCGLMIWYALAAVL